MGSIKLCATTHSPIQATLRGWIYCRDNAVLCVDLLQQPDGDPSGLTPQQFNALQTLGLAEVCPGVAGYRSGICTSQLLRRRC